MLRTLLPILILSNLGCNRGKDKENIEVLIEKISYGVDAIADAGIPPSEDKDTLTDVDGIAQDDPPEEAANDDQDTNDEKAENREEKDEKKDGETIEAGEEVEVPVEEINPEDIEIIEEVKAPEKEEVKAPEKEEKKAVLKTFTTRVTGIARNPIKSLNTRIRAKAMRSLRTKARKAGYLSVKKGQKITRKRCTRGTNSQCSATVSITFIKYE